MKVNVRSPTKTIFVPTLEVVVVDGIVFAIILYCSYEHFLVGSVYPNG